MTTRKKLDLAALLIALLAFALPAFALDQAKPGENPAAPDPHAGLTMPPAAAGMPAAPDVPEDRTAFEAQIHLDTFRLLAIQHLDQVKILDSWARQCISKIHNSSTIDGKDPLYVALDMSFRPEVWAVKNIIYIQAIPIREELMKFAPDRIEADRIRTQGLVSPAFLVRPEVLKYLDEDSHDSRHADAVGKVYMSMQTFLDLADSFAIVPPPPSRRGDHWTHPGQFLTPELSATDSSQPAAMPAAHVAGYTPEQSLKIDLAVKQLVGGWQANQPELANTGIASLTALLPTIDPADYPSSAKRTTELWYNRTHYGTEVNVFLYFIAMTLFILVAVGVTKKVHRIAFIIFTVAVLVHLASMGVRFWLAGRWPTQNQFESVLGAALLGCVVGWLLELWKKNGLFGMAFSFVGFLAMTACMAAPYMFNNDLGGAISKTAGILQTYWLYIHVNIVISSYALISGTFILGAAYLLTHLWYWINPLEPAAETEPAFPVNSAMAMAGGPGASVASTLDPAAIEERQRANLQIEAERSATLAVLDQANMVILQMAFWFLGIGIICGAVWADHSWGRPWGWDPKETFALITWIVYLIIVHVRVVIPKIKADTTAVLSVIGFGVMMFNWIGVNFFLAGLHSYA